MTAQSILIQHSIYAEKVVYILNGQYKQVSPYFYKK